MRVNLGGETRQIIAGLREYLGADELIGKSAIIVANLKHAKLRGLESQGMLLAAEKDGRVVLIHPAEEKVPGTRVGTGYYELKKTVGIEELQKKELRIEGGAVASSDGALKTEDGTPVVAGIEDGAVVR